MVFNLWLAPRLVTVFQNFFFFNFSQASYNKIINHKSILHSKFMKRKACPAHTWSNSLLLQCISYNFTHIFIVVYCFGPHFYLRQYVDGGRPIFSILCFGKLMSSHFALKLIWPFVLLRCQRKYTISRTASSCQVALTFQLMNKIAYSSLATCPFLNPL